MGYTPPYPKPLNKNSKRSPWNLYKRTRKSWLATLYEGSYKGNISRVKLPGLQVFVVKIPKLIKEVLVDKFEAYPKHEISEMFFKPLLGRSVFTTNGALWQKQRKMLDPAFGQAKLKEVFTLMSAGSEAMVKRFDELEDGGVADIEIEMTHVTADIILRTILSENLEGEEAQKIFHLFHTFQEKAAIMINLGFFHVPRWILPHHYIAWKRSGKEIRKLLLVPMKKRYDAYHRGEKGDYKDILQSLLEARDPDDGSQFTLEELVDQVAILFIAGHETSATALAWSLFLLAKCPEIQENLHDETVMLLGDREPEFKDIPRHKKIRNVFRETMRLYPPVGFLTFRRSATDQKLNDREIPAGSTVVISPWLLHRHRELWEKPDEFDPERFEGGLDQPSCAYIPFGHGPRICIGAAFAIQEAMLILATLTRRYRFEPGPGPDPVPVSRITIRSMDGISLRVWKRPQHSEKGTPFETAPTQESPPAGEAKCPFQ